MEVETQVLLAKRLRYIEADAGDRLLKQCAAIGSALTGLINSLRDAMELTTA